ncbi:MAG: divergent polysaccharide deacetylase family protein [bacterium]
MKEDTSQPQVVLPETKPTPIYEPLKPLSKEKTSIKETPAEKTPTKGNEDTVLETKKEVTTVVEDNVVTSEERLDPKLEESIKSLLIELNCKVQKDWNIEVPTFCSIEWLRRRLNAELLKLGYRLEGNIIYENNKEIVEFKFNKAQPRGKIAIIIDDVGRSTRLNRVLEGINLPLNISILPKQSKSREMSILGKKMGWDVLLHLPMEPIGKGWVDDTFIRINMDKKQIEDKVTSYLQELPYVNGINNHMGSLATTNEEVMRTILGIVKGRGLYFVDSLTTSNSVGEKVSKEIGLERFAKRDVFLDNIDNRGYINSQIDKLVEFGIKNGFAIGIGHLRENTLLTIRDYSWEDKEVELVLLSEIL